jgi:hypothetical protein
MTTVTNLALALALAASATAQQPADHGQEKQLRRR